MGRTTFFFFLLQYEFSLGDQLACVKHGNDRLEDFVADRGQDAVVVVDTVLLEDDGEVGDIGAVEDSEGDVDVLHVFSQSR